MKPIKEPRRNQNIKLIIIDVEPSRFNKLPGKSGMISNPKHIILLVQKLYNNNSIKPIKSAIINSIIQIIFFGFFILRLLIR